MSSKRLKSNAKKVTKNRKIDDEIEIMSKDLINGRINKSKPNSNKKFCNNNNAKNLLENEKNSFNINNNNNNNIVNNGKTDENVDDLSLNYKPKLFLRCHCRQNDPFDNTTSIWSASFQPNTGQTHGTDSNDSNDGNRFVATCGANMVCIIDCEKTVDSLSQSVIARYIDENKDEDLVSLAWNAIPLNSGGDCHQNNSHSILAVGGKRNILLLSTNQFHCYERLTDAHSDAINALAFNEKGQLLSGSYDQKIKIWNISSPNDEKVTQMWKCVDTNNQLLSLCFSLKYKAIIASGNRGITFWSNISEENDSGLGQIKTNRLVDGIHTLPDDEDSIVVRIYDSKSITIIDLKKAINEIMISKNTSKIKPILWSKVKKAKLESFELGFPYIYLSAQKNLLVSGGPNGNIFLYKTNKFEDYYNNNKVNGKPDRIIEWPPIENIIKDGKKIIDDEKFVIVNTIAISPNLKYIIGCTNMNLICIWHNSSPN